MCVCKVRQRGWKKNKEGREEYKNVKSYKESFPERDIPKTSLSLSLPLSFSISLYCSLSPQYLSYFPIPPSLSISLFLYLFLSLWTHLVLFLSFPCRNCFMLASLRLLYCYDYTFITLSMRYLHLFLQEPQPTLPTGWVNTQNNSGVQCTYIHYYEDVTNKIKCQ